MFIVVVESVLVVAGFSWKVDSCYDPLRCGNLVDRDIWKCTSKSMIH